MSLYVDDGVKDRSHRKAITNKTFKNVGIAYCPHKSKYAGMVSIAYSGSYSLKSESHAEIKRRFAARRENSNVDVAAALTQLQKAPKKKRNWF